MNGAVLLRLTVEAVGAHRLRYGLSALAIAIGVAAVVLMASIGEGLKRYVASEITQFGTTLISINPGRVATGGVPGMMGGSARKLTLDDARALRRLPGVACATPDAFGSAIVERGNRSRRMYVFGVVAEAQEVWSWPVAVGQFLPQTDWDRGGQVAVLGTRARHELFGSENPLGAVVRIGQSRFRVIGVMESRGQYVGFDFDDSVFIPVATAMRLLNLTELGEINLKATSPAAVEPLARAAERLMEKRHRGERDVTVMTQAEGMRMITSVLDVITLVVTAIAGISLLVGAIGILTILWIVVHEREAEIGLVKALGASRRQVLTWYLFEAAATAVAGGLSGLALGLGAAWALAQWVPGLETYTPVGVVAAAVGMAIGVGLFAGVAPALRATRLDPVECLRGD